MVKVVAEAIATLSMSGLTIVLVEQSTQVALQLSTRTYVLGEGRVNLQAASAELRNDGRLLASYLGGNATNPTPLNK